MKSTPLLLTGVLAALMLAACERGAAPPAPPLAVLVREVTPAGVAPLAIYTGEVRSRYETELSFRVAGKLVERRAELGGRVRRGELLARLDPQDLQLSASAARDQLAAAEAELTLARAEYERASALVAKNFLSGSALDGRRSALAAAEARVRQARSQAAVSQNQAGYAELRAEHDAVVTGVQAERGEVVAAGQPVLRLAREDARELLVHVPESRIAGLRVGMPAEVRPIADPQRRYAARVQEVAAAADAATRSFAVRLAVAGADGGLPLGASAAAGLPGGAAAGTLLPLPALAQHDGASVVWVVDAGGTVQPHAVEVLALREDGALIGSGLEPGLRVVVAGAHRLTPGLAVRAVPEQAPVALDAGR